MGLKLLFVGDIHLSDTTPRSRTDNYMAAIFIKLVQIAKIAKGYDHVLLTGDIFHRKKPENNSHYMVGTLMDILKTFPKGRTHALVGNHDLRDGNLGRLDEQPLGVIFKTGLLDQLTHDQVWVKDGTVVQVAPLPFSYEAETNPTYYECARLPGVDFLIRFTHASILPESLPFLAYKMPHVGVDKIWGQSWNLLVNGHIHHHSPVVQNGKQSFVNVGAIARGALNSWALEQTPKVLGVEIEKSSAKYTWHDLKVQKATDIFRVEDAIREKEQKKDLDVFVQDIKNSEGQVVLQAQSFDLPTMLEDFLVAQKASATVKRKVTELINFR